LTVKKNAAILALIPEACKRTDVNSTKAIANDLSKAEADKIGADSKKGGAKAKLKSEGNTKGKQDSIVKGKGKGKAKVADKEETEDEEDFQCGEDDDENANANADNEMLSNDSVDDEHYDEAPPSASPQDFHLPPAATSKPNSKRKWTADEADKPSNDVLDSSSRRPKRARTGVPLPEQPICQPTNARKSVGQARVGAESNYQAGKSVSALLPSANACPAKVFDESDDDSSQMETDSEPEDGDYRYIDPIGRASDGNDQATIQRALELTRIEFFDKTGNVVPQSLAVDFCYESYASQHRRIQEDYRKYRKGFLDAPKLFRLAAWKGGFSKWKVTYATSRNGANPTGWNLKVRMLNEEDRQAREDAQLAKKIEREERAGKS